MSFTATEIQNKINQFLRTSVGVTRTRTGSRDILKLRDEVYDLITTSLLLRPDSVFHVVSRTVNRLEALRRKQVITTQAVLDELPNVTRRGIPIESTAELANAQAALLEINAGLNRRSTGVRGAIGPGVTRFQGAAGRFLENELAKNVVSGGAIVDTADGSRETISTLFAELKERHTEMLFLTEALENGIAQLDQVRLPESTVQSIVTRIQSRLADLIAELGGSQGLARSREGALDLFVMRVILARASSFRAPSLAIAPVSGTGTALVDAGVVPGALPTLSGPFNFIPGTLDLVTGGGALAPLAFTEDSRATITLLLSVGSFDFGVGAELQISVDDGAAISVAVAGVTTDAALATAIDTALGAAGTSTVVGGFVQIQSAEEGDASSLTIEQDTADRQLFVALTAPSALRAQGTPIPAVTLADAIAASPAHAAEVSATVVRTDYGTHVSPVSAVVTEENLVQVPSGALLPVGARIIVTDGDGNNRGYYRVLSATSGTARLDRDLPTLTGTITYVAFVETLTLSATAAGPLDGINVTTSALATAIGLTTAASLVKGSGNSILAYGKGSNFLELGVRPSDLLILDGDTAETARTILTVGQDSLTFSPPYPYGTGATTTTAFNVRSARYQSYRFFLDGTSSRKGAIAWAEQWSDLDEMDRRVGQVIRGGLPQQAEAVLLAYLDSETSGTVPPDPGKVPDLTTLGADVAAFSVPFESTIDNILRLLSEQGMDRALELLLTLQMVEFFTMPAEGASFATWLNRQAAEAARTLAPVSKFARSDRAIREVQPLSSQLDPMNPQLDDYNDILDSDF